VLQKLQTWQTSNIKVITVLPTKNIHQEALETFKEMFKCDSARISSPLGKTLFLIIGYKRNTREDKGQWVDQQGKHLNWDYLLETCIASGDTEFELMESARRYLELKETKQISNLHQKISVQFHNAL